MKRQVQFPAVMGVAAVMALSAAAWAGSKINSQVTITVTGATGTASGSMGAVRNSSDTVQNIGCAVNTNYNGTLPGAYSSSIYCSARDAAGVTVGCLATHPDFIAVVHSITSDSSILFKWDANGDCTLLTVSTYSYYAPKAP
jgi:GTP cyclohydrolase III